ncbi:M14 family zinc carboxypeptidase [Roseimicrobium sp. ORNL1]|uniref:M14 family zinc carboxypeptidase n=1 Tax=Roseimicrobium sp. ORNL1 TaxID=2711231 RepID=UPI0013E15905|nr:M14 family zinc carboxypeptidase [Roseimicrobium sp. ORNL1]QIF03382.1 alpha/beta hydrolase fold domain-containing protein [Roseimicrobium sp. ORNL1]
MKRLLPLFVGILMTGASQAAPPSTSPKEEKSSESAMQAQYPLVPRLTQDEYEATLRHWRTKYPKTFTFQKRGESPEGFAIYLAKVTDTAVSDADKQVCLVTALHSGPEHSGTTASFALMEWLLGDSPEAAETRRRQVVLFMPVINPMALFHTDRFRNSKGVDPYTSVGPLGKALDARSLMLKNPEAAPEVAAVLSVIDEYQPEVHADLHGIGLQEYSPEQLGQRRLYQGQMMTEVTGSAYSNYTLRPWDWRVTEAMIAAGREAGFPSDRFEADAQRSLTGPEVAVQAGRLWSGQPLFYTSQYGYFKYHTMILALETAWEESAVARMRGLLQLGNMTWEDERAPGYPVGRMKSLIGRFITTWGRNAAERRASRAELWPAQEHAGMGLLYPETWGRATLVCATSRDAKQALQGDLKTLATRIAPFTGEEQAVALNTFFANGPEIKVALDTTMTKPNAESIPALKHGIGFRLRLPTLKPGKLDVRLNGMALPESREDGYEAWTADGWTQVQVHVPPAKAAAMSLYFVTCAYQPAEKRVIGWLPPAEVRASLKSDVAHALLPTHAEVPYGPHFRQTLDLWLARSEKPTPLVVYIHGGGWNADDKSDIHRHLDVKRLLDAGISTASVNYRFIRDAQSASVHPPVQWPLQDAARALQLLRHRAGEWGLDPERIGATGVSAGGCTALWLGLHDDLAKADASDPIARKSTRLSAVAVKAAQTTLDPQLMLEWIPGSNYGGHAFGLQKPGMSRPDAFPPLLAARAELQPLIDEYSPLHHLSAGDPPLLLYYPRQAQIGSMKKGSAQSDPAHSALFGALMEDPAKATGVSLQLLYPGGPVTEDDSMESFLIRHLTAR